MRRARVNAAFPILLSISCQPAKRVDSGDERGERQSQDCLPLILQVSDQVPPGASQRVNKHIVALPKQLCQNHCLIRQNVVRYECITCIFIPQDFICYFIVVSHCMFHFNKQLFLVALLHFFVFSQFHFVTLVFLFFLFLFTLYVLFLPKDRN